LQPGGPAAEVSSFAWQIALNLSQAFWFPGLEKFDFLGELAFCKSVDKGIEV
jgi:hypothetical protein